MAGDTGNWSLYSYNANKAAPIFFAVLLSILGIIQIYQSFIRYRWKKFGGTMLWATGVWIAGFILRTISIYRDQNVNIFIAQFVMVLMGPPLYAAAEYFILGRLMAYLPYFAPIHPGRVISTFILLSTVVEALTANGAANSAGKDRNAGQREAGLACLKAALILQCFVEALFFSLVMVMELRCRKAKAFNKNIRTVVYMLYTTSAMILVRCVVRTIEGFEESSCPPNQPPCGYIANHEWVFYLFEVANITLFVIILAVLHPGRYLPRDSRIFLDPSDRKTERVGPGFGKADKRPFLLTVFDPFNIGGIVTGKGMTVTKFWDQYHPIYDGGELPPLKHGGSYSREVANP